jgi:hypothetical protein
MGLVIASLPKARRNDLFTSSVKELLRRSNDLLAIKRDDVTS